MVIGIILLNLADNVLSILVTTINQCNKMVLVNLAMRVKKLTLMMIIKLAGSICMVADMILNLDLRLQVKIHMIAFINAKTKMKFTDLHHQIKIQVV